MTNTLYLHIGHYKTGTTALQVFSATNRKLLLSEGIDYAQVLLHNAKHSALAFSLCHHAGVTDLMHGYSDPTPPEALWRELFDYACISASPTVLASSEELIRIGEFPEAVDELKRIATLAEGLEIKVIAYLRSPQDHLRSWYNQLIKMGCTVPDFDAAVAGQMESIHIDYSKALTPWIEAFGAENVILRQYHGTGVGPDHLFADFLSVFGLALDHRYKRPEKDPNPRLDDRAIELIRLAQNMELPKKTVETIQAQASSFLNWQDTVRPAQARSFDALRASAAAGVTALAQLPGSDLDIAAFQQDLPAATPEAEITQTLLTGFVMSELVGLRQRINRSMPDLSKRVRQLETRLAALEKAGKAPASPEQASPDTDE